MALLQIVLLVHSHKRRRKKNSLLVVTLYSSPFSLDHNFGDEFIVNCDKLSLFDFTMFFFATKIKSW